MTFNLAPTHSTQPCPRRSRAGSELAAAALLAFVAAGIVGPASAKADGDIGSSSVSGRAAARPESENGVAAAADSLSRAESALERRVLLLSRELNLDPAQQAAVRRLLLQQRAQTLQVWSDEAAPAALRVKATQGVAERTAERIRALLNDEQRRRYMQPHSHAAEQTVAAGDVESWMRGTAPASANLPRE
jgi:hypothetical protein